MNALDCDNMGDLLALPPNGDLFSYIQSKSPTSISELVIKSSLSYPDEWPLFST